jgi:hypothetical protein
MIRLWDGTVSAVRRNPGLPFALAVVVIMVVWLAVR